MFDLDTLAALNRNAERKARRIKRERAERMARLEVLFQEDPEARRTDDLPYMPYSDGGYEP